MNDKQFDDLLNIETITSINTYEDKHHHRYEATSIQVLDKIIDSDILNKDNIFVDFGSGKGRVDFYINYKIGCKCIGIEFNKEIYELSINNKNNAKLNNVDFILVDACKFKINKDMDRFYFFNPFSIVIFKQVLNNILDSYYEYEREIVLIFYYPQDDYIHYLLNHDHLLCIDEIDTNLIFHTNDIQERILIFEVI